MFFKKIYMSMCPYCGYVYDESEVGGFCPKCGPRAISIKRILKYK